MSWVVPAGSCRGTVKSTCIPEGTNEPRTTRNSAGISSRDASSATYTYTNVLWDSDWTAAQIAGMQLTVQAVQTGKATAADWQVDEIEVDIDYTEASSGPSIPIVMNHRRTIGAS